MRIPTGSDVVKSKRVSRPGIERGEFVTFVDAVLDVWRRDISGHFIEIGVRRAKSTSCLSKLIRMRKESRSLFSIDSDPTAAERHRRVCYAFQEKYPALFILGASQDPYVVAKVPDGAALLFIDGCHCRECVAADCELYIPKLVDGGIVIFHDFHTDGHTPTARCMRLNTEVVCGVHSAVESCSAYSRMTKLRESPPWTPGVASFSVSKVQGQQRGSH